MPLWMFYTRVRRREQFVVGRKGRPGVPKLSDGCAIKTGRERRIVDGENERSAKKGHHLNPYPALEGVEQGFWYARIMLL
jgi:hypothetical protein